MPSRLLFRWCAGGWEHGACCIGVLWCPLLVAQPALAKASAHCRPLHREPCPIPLPLLRRRVPLTIQERWVLQAFIYFTFSSSIFSFSSVSILVCRGRCLFLLLLSLTIRFFGDPETTLKSIFGNMVKACHTFFQSLFLLGVLLFKSIAPTLPFQTMCEKKKKKKREKKRKKRSEEK